MGKGPPLFLAAAHRAFMAAASRARPAFVKVRFFFAGLASGLTFAEPFWLLNFAQRFFCAALIFASAFGDNFLLPVFPFAEGATTADEVAALAPKIEAISACNFSIRSASSSPRFS
ncbi:MAG: hypothetical protein ABMA01_00105 [Chthoniobacteraceae bacterium]